MLNDIVLETGNGLVLANMTTTSSRVLQQTVASIQKVLNMVIGVSTSNSSGNPISTLEGEFTLAQSYKW